MSDDWNTSHTRICPHEDTEDDAGDESCTASYSPSGSSSGHGRAEPPILFGGKRTSRTRLGRGRYIQSRSWPQGKEDRPIRSDSRDSSRSTHRASRCPSPGSICQVPERSHEPSPDDWPETSSQTQRDYDSTVGQNGSRKKPQGKDRVPRGIRSARWEGSLLWLHKPRGNRLRGIRPSGNQNQADEPLSRRMDDYDPFEVPQQATMVDDYLHPIQLSFFDMVSDGTTRASSSLSTQDKV